LAGTGLVVGLAAEARIARTLGSAVIISGAAADPVRAASRLVDEGASSLLSFGLAGGLDPGLPRGTLVVPRAVLVEEGRFETDPILTDALGGATCHSILGASEIVGDAREKHRLWQQTGACAVDTESGAVARVARRHGLPFAVLRAICDPAERSLPAAALAALGRAGKIQLAKVLASIAADPAQLPALIVLARDAAAARRSLIRRVAELRERLAGV
jgi:adenosylhomocysteine nucleosidase